MKSGVKMRWTLWKRQENELLCGSAEYQHREDGKEVLHTVDWVKGDTEVDWEKMSTTNIKWNRRDNRHDS